MRHPAPRGMELQGFRHLRQSIYEIIETGNNSGAGVSISRMN